MDNPIRLHWLDPRNPRQPFPPPQLAMREPNGLLAIGGDLSVTRLLRAYSAGIFPWYNPDEPILWWCPDPRAVLAPQDFHTSRSLAKRLRKRDFAVSMNAAFPRVLEACAAPRARGRGTWLGPEMKHAYAQLHERGFAQSVEVWRRGELVGGLYGVSLGRMFYGESMFSRIDDGSKIAFHYLCAQLAAWRFELMDCQIASRHLATLGAAEMPRERFLARLGTAVAAPGRTGRWQFEIEVPAPREHRPAGAAP
ncbi:MAG TPA: leucyl/phenylalanyl-tRNA--protein transferase [Candidatus Binatia bacterium]|nr:leucyl/phenylalanyl-tRNA--protein transferase [Candidatus Binatia bacterium]